MEENYSEESVQELLAWAGERLDKKDYPQEWALSQSTKIPDCGVFLQAMQTTVSNNWKNPVFYPLIDELRLFRKQTGL